MGKSSEDAVCSSARATLVIACLRFPPKGLFSVVLFRVHMNGTKSHNYGCMCEYVPTHTCSFVWKRVDTSYALVGW